MKVVPDDIASTFVHGTQKKIAEVFTEAERMAPTVLFLDEFDAMVPTRTSDDHGCQNGEVNEFLCRLNHANERGVYLIAATNHPESIDKAVLRTGRFDERIYIDMPDTLARERLLRLALHDLPKAADIDYARLAEMTAGYNCSDIKYIIQVAARKMFNASIEKPNAPYREIDQQSLEEAIAGRTPSVGEKELREYERVRDEMRGKKPAAAARSIGFQVGQH